MGPTAEQKGRLTDYRKTNRFTDRLRDRLLDRQKG